MAMNVQNTLAAYGNYQNSYNAGKTKEKKETQNLQSTENVAKEEYVSQGEKQLSKSAQKMLQTLRNSRTDMDFMVADFHKGDNAKEILSHSDKEFTVIFSSEELEKMASNPKYYNEKMRSIDGAVRMSEEINAQFGFERALGKTDVLASDVAMTKFGISFNSDGSTTFFAELEKISSKQKERLEELQNQKDKEKTEEKKKPQDTDVKRVTLHADTKEALLEKINEIDWDKVKADTQMVGGRFDFTV